MFKIIHILLLIIFVVSIFTVPLLNIVKAKTEILSIANNNGEFKFKVADSPDIRYYPYILVDGSALAANQLAINVPSSMIVKDVISISVTTGAGANIDNAEVSFDGDVIGNTNSTGKLEYTLTKAGLHNITSTKLGYETATKTVQIAEYVDSMLNIQCLPDKSLIKPITEPRNIIIVIDASGSTTGEGIIIVIDASGRQREYTTTSFISLINANAINIIQNTGWDSRVGIVAFGGSIEIKGLLSMSNETNKAELNKFVKSIYPTAMQNPTNLDKALIAAEELLSSGETKEVIVLSDGNILSEDFERIKNSVIELKNKEIKIQFVQVLLEYEKIKKPNSMYNDLAKTVDGEVIVLNPDEKIASFIEIASPKENAESKRTNFDLISHVQSYEEPCSTNVSETITITVLSESGVPIESAEVSFENTIIGTTNNSGKIDNMFTSSGNYTITAAKLGYENAVKMIQVLPIKPIDTVNPNVTINPELLRPTLNRSNETQREMKKNPGFELIMAISILFLIHVFLKNRIRS